MRSQSGPFAGLPFLAVPSFAQVGHDRFEGIVSKGRRQRKPSKGLRRRLRRGFEQGASKGVFSKKAWREGGEGFEGGLRSSLLCQRCLTLLELLGGHNKRLPLDLTSDEMVSSTWICEGLASFS